MAMKHRLVLAAIALMMLAPFSAQAGEQSVVLSVHHAGCVLCGPIVKAALEGVTGVKTVTVSQADAMADVTAKVTFDDSVASVPTLIAATTNAGYPAHLAK
jgi:periplasmic mercuric ion binding protein